MSVGETESFVKRSEKNTDCLVVPLNFPQRIILLLVYVAHTSRHFKFYTWIFFYLLLNSIFQSFKYKKSMFQHDPLLTNATATSPKRVLIQ